MPDHLRLAIGMAVLALVAGLTGCSNESASPSDVPKDALLATLDSAMPVDVVVDESWDRLLRDLLCGQMSASYRNANETPALSPSKLPLDCKIVQTSVLKSGKLRDGDLIAMIKYGQAVLSPPPRNEVERRSFELAAEDYPRGSEKDERGYWVVHEEDLKVEVLRVRQTSEGLQLVESVSTVDPATGGEVPGA